MKLNVSLCATACANELAIPIDLAPPNTHPPHRRFGHAVRTANSVSNGKLDRWLTLPNSAFLIFASWLWLFQRAWGWTPPGLSSATDNRIGDSIVAPIGTDGPLLTAASLPVPCIDSSEPFEANDPARTDHMVPAPWLASLRQLDQQYTRARGTAGHVLERTQQAAQRWFHGIRHCREIFVASNSDEFT